MIRVEDPVSLGMGLSQWMGILGDEFNPFEWLDGDNVALQSGDSYSLFQHEAPGIYTGHYFFSKQDRGKKAKALGKAMLDEAFEFAEIIRGLTPLDNLPARWMARHLGFTSYGAVTPQDMPCELFIMTKAEFKEKHNG